MHINEARLLCQGRKVPQNCSKYLKNAACNQLAKLKKPGAQIHFKYREQTG